MDRRRAPLPTWLPLCAPIAAIALVLLKSLGAPLGEPVADDFDFLVATLRGDVSFFSGGGSQSFWRPIPHQFYYSILGRSILSHPWVTPVLHATVLLGIGYLLILGLRRRLGLATACGIATFVLLAEPVRAMLSWPSHAVELGGILFMSAALWALGTRRFAWLAPIFLLGLLCKESMALLLVLAPFWPDAGWTLRSRVRIGLVLAACLALWGASYLWIASSHDIHPPRGITTSPSIFASTFLQRIAWAAGRSGSVGLGLWHLSGWRAVIGLGAYLVVGACLLLRWWRIRTAKGSVPADRVVWWAAALTAGSVLALTITYPSWAPHRAVQVSIGLAIVLFYCAGRIAASVRLALVAVKALTLVLAAPPISSIGVLPPEHGNVLDFERLTRLQLLCRDIRSQLAERAPLLPRRSLVVQRNFPHAATYALGGSHALQSWRQDTTLRWIGFESFVDDPRLPVGAVVDFEEERRPAVSILPPRAVRLQILGDSLLSTGRVPEALASFDQALSSLGGLPAPSFEASCRYRRAVILARLGQVDAAIGESRSAVNGTSAGVDARFLLAILLADRGNLVEARLQVDSILMRVPGEPRAVDLGARLLGHSPGPR